MLKKIQTDKAPTAIGPYSQAIIACNLVYLSGQLPIHPQTGQLVEDDIQIQTERVLENMRAILNECKISFEQVIKTEVFLIDLGEFNLMNDIYAKYFCHPIQPARTTIQAARLPREARIEISCIATLNDH